MSSGTTRPDPRSRPDILRILLTVAATTALVAVAVTMGNRHRQASLEDQREERAAVRQADAAQRGALFVPKTPTRLAAAGPWSEAWRDAPAMEIPLQAQRVAMPMLDAVSVETVALQALTDGERMAWRVSWADPSTDANVDSARFSDAVALQFPVAREAHFTMGKDGERVQILHWKALWQKDVDEHFQDVQDLHPNYWADLYWFAEGERPFPVPDSFRDPRSRQWFAAYAAGNPVADFERRVPVEELIAEGFGSLTTQPEQVTTGRGEWRDGEWAVVFLRPLRTDDGLDTQFWNGGRGNVAIAVWDGGAGNVGGRKHWSNWVEYEVSP